MKKFSVSIDDGLYEEICADADGNVSRWLADAARDDFITSA